MPRASEVADQQKQQLLKQLEDPDFALQMLQAMASTEAGRELINEITARNSQRASKYEDFIGTARRTDLGGLRECFVRGTKISLESVLGTAPMPFPSDLVVEITETQVRSLQHVFDIPDADKYAQWAIVYTGVNRQAHENRLSSSDITQGLRKTIGAEDLPEGFFLLAYSYLLEQRRKPALIEQKSGLWANLDKLTQTNAVALQSTVQSVLDLMQLAKEGDNAGRSKLMLPQATNWYREHRLDELLSGLIEAAKQDKVDSEALFDHLYERDRKYNPSGKADSVNPDYVYRAVDRMSEILAESKGWKKRDGKGARNLFSWWGFTVDPAALKVARGRREG